MMADDEKYENEAENDNNDDDDIDDEDELMFGGQVPRAPTQVTGLTTIEKSKTLMMLSTSKVNTKPNQHSKPSEYVPSSDLFNFANPARPDDELEVAMNQTYKGQPIDDQSPIPNQQQQQTNPTFAQPTVARSHGDGIHNKYSKHLYFKSDGETPIVFGKLNNKSSCCLLICSTILALLFCITAILFFPKFGGNKCNESPCAYTEVPSDLVKGVVQHELLLISGCSTNRLFFSYNDGSVLVNSSTTLSPNDATLSEKTFEDLQELGSDAIDTMYVSGTNDGGKAKLCSTTIESTEVTDENIILIDGYIDLDSNVWDWSTTGFFLVLCIIMALFFILIEWLFYSYNEIMIPYKDYRAYIMWYLIRMGWMSFMFTIIIAHSFMVTGDINFMVGTFGYVWLEGDCYIATSFIGIFFLICLCCCCFQESDGFTGNNLFSSQEDFGCERYFLPKSRMEALVINDFEQGLGSAMCSSMIFVIAFLVCGFVPFMSYISGALGGYTNFPFIASIWFLTIIVMSFQMCWFVRARCCGDEDDKQRAAMHDNAVQQRSGQPQFDRAKTAPVSLRSIR